MTKPFIRQETGATAIVVGLAFFVLLAVMGTVIDLSRIYAVRSKAQQAADAALLGAVATINTNTGSLTETVQSLFAANYPLDYMGAVVNDVSVASGDDGVYQMNFSITVPTLIMGLGLTDNMFTLDEVVIDLSSQVTRRLDQRRLELALVLDNTGSMAGERIASLKQASRDLTNILFGDDEVLPNLHISVVPYHVAVRIGPGHQDWVQFDWRDEYNGPAFGFIANRNSDNPPNGYNDISDAAPLSEATRFRLPNDTTPPGGNWDHADINLRNMRFAMNNKSEILGMLDTMTAAGNTRINVGLMWGWFTLSPNWQGLWIAGDNSLPESPNELLDKAVVLMTDGANTVYRGIGGLPNDDATTAALCAAIKQQNITLYSIGYGASVNQGMLQTCASQPAYYFYAPDSAALQTAFSAIADDLLFRSLRLTK